MRRIATLLSCFLFLSGVARAQLQNGACSVYFGTVAEGMKAEFKIGMVLSVQGKTLEGAYFDRKSLKDTLLKGSFGDERDITLDVCRTLPSGIYCHPRNGIFYLHFAEHDPHYSSTDVLKGEVLKGIWITEQGGIEQGPRFLVSLSLEHTCSKPGAGEYEIAGAKDDEQVEKNAQGFLGAVLRGDHSEAAKYVSYPCTFVLDGKRAAISNEADFLKNYDVIFTKEYVAKIASGVPHHMFANYQGIMIADGAVWFDAEGKAKNFNNSSAP